MPVSDELVAEINQSIEASMEAKSAEAVKTTPENTPTEEPVAEAHTEDDMAMDSTPSKESDDLAGKATEEPIATAPVKEPTAVALSNDALTRAVRAGISLDDAHSFTNEAALLRVVERMEAAVKPITPPVEAPPEDLFAGIPVLDPEEYEPEVIAAFESLKKVIQKQQQDIQQFKDQTSHIARSSQEAHAAEVASWFDSKIAGLGEDFNDTLGTGATMALTPGSPQALKRDSIATTAAALLQGYRATGQKVPPRDEVFDAAARIVLKDEYIQAHEKRLSSELAKRSTQHLARAKGANGQSKKTPQEDIAAEIDQKFFGKT
jgi:hypothetical protein